MVHSQTGREAVASGVRGLTRAIEEPGRDQTLIGQSVKYLTYFV